MLIRALIIWLALVGIAAAQTVNTADSYLVFSTQAAALARSQTQCTALKCDGVQTIYWWNVIGPLNAGTAGSTAVAANSYAVEIQPSGPYGATTTTSKVAVPTGLSTSEQSSLVTGTALGPLAPGGTVTSGGTATP